MKNDYDFYNIVAETNTNANSKRTQTANERKANRKRTQQAFQTRKQTNAKQK